MMMSTIKKIKFLVEHNPDVSKLTFQTLEIATFVWTHQFPMKC